MKPQLFLVAGPNGSGKSTLTLAVKRRFPDVEVVDPDAIVVTQTLALPDNKVAAGRRALMLVRQHIQKKQSLMVESTISGTGYLRYVHQAQALGFRTAFIFLALKSPEICVQRVAKRVALGGHDVPLQDIHRRYYRSLGHMKRFIALCDSAHVYDNSEHYQWIAAYRCESMHRRAKEIPCWLAQHLS